MRSERVRWTGIGCAVLAVVLTALVVARWRPLLSYDDQAVLRLHPYAVGHPGVTHLVRILTDWVWDPWTMRALAAAACGWLWRRGERERALRIAAATVAAAAVQQALKALVGRERPMWPDPIATAHFAAYPSGHAMTAAAVCGLLLWLLPRARPKRRAWAGAAWALAALSVLGVGFTRVYVGVHWPSDVVGGWLLGAALAASAISLPLHRHRPETGVS
ncbi:phosphatase PAP2 family protein [Streptomyces sp. NPDC044571]|uniref:phosphatase PAP2 family protein n=1 Tax=Streptomyces sp. NPDC044571 TaxID=3155371 RepID=UPI0034027930